MTDIRRLREQIEERIREQKRRQEGERWYSQTYAEAAMRITVYYEVLALLEDAE